ncbi:sulfite exporter TauE/SafE family protein [Thalassotalea sp. 1_MG-2023]|uniref:sulfite exporter TauE/SafE family protein n=1 Tax=Thalassotalea sp. 1_MG-2023 TaxID=3062680 RepID=UPI0026E3F792|nr:sulfite exporter TauE/SafE family protein [Thalassotalea sp. 1_MG-2023]MDO6426400.1 sulfite exporter TauE/SafE family protein [Thalassotalea sp. 1_MG-2023]
MFINVVISCALLGCIAGFLAGLLGIGGGLVIVPALVYLLPLLGVNAELVMPIAIATSLASIVFTSASASFAHHKNSNIPWPLAKQLMIMIALGAISGAYVADSLSTEVLTYIFATAVIILASYMLFSIKVQKSKPLPGDHIIRVMGFGTGCISSMMGIAGGAILVPLLSYYSVSIRHAIGTATVCGLVVALFGAAGFIITGLDQPNLPQWSLGYIFLPALLGIVLTSSLFAPYGVRMAGKLPVRYLQRMFAGFLILVAIRMIFR